MKKSDELLLPVPLFPPYEALVDLDFNDYPELNAFLQSSDQPWRIQHWQWAQKFLIYIGRNKSSHTYVRFRNDVERFLLWLFIEHDKPMDHCRKTDILLYADFCWSPPEHWINTVSVDKFMLLNGRYMTNPKWSPFKFTVPKNIYQHHVCNTSSHEHVIDKSQYQPSQQTLSATFTAMGSFYAYLMAEEICYANPVQVAKKDCRHFIYDAQVKDVKRLTGSQWDYVFNTALDMANQDPKYERSLFVVCALKTLFLRISELAVTPNWTPVMSHFWEDSQENFWLKIYGKGRKIRDISVPTSFIVYLKRYRQARGLAPLPHSSEQSPIVEKIRGKGGMTARHLRRLVQEVFDRAYVSMRDQEGEDRARKLQEASTHWLRHTGASMEIERGRTLKDVSEDLGHASMATTDTIYVQAENANRAKSGKNRQVSD